MTNKEKLALRAISDSIKKLASLETASFDFDKETDDYIKSKIRLYMTWFESDADYLEKVIKASECTDRYDKERMLDSVIRYSY